MIPILSCLFIISRWSLGGITPYLLVFLFLCIVEFPFNSHYFFLVEVHNILQLLIPLPFIKMLLSPLAILLLSFFLILLHLIRWSSHWHPSWHVYSHWWDVFLLSKFHGYRRLKLRLLLITILLYHIFMVLLPLQSWLDLHLLDLEVFLTLFTLVPFPLVFLPPRIEILIEMTMILL